MAAAVPTNIHPTDTPPFTLAAPPVVPPLLLFPPPEPLEEPDPPLAPPPPAPAALAPTVKMGKAVPVKEVWNSDGPSTQTAPPLPSKEQVSCKASSCHTVAPWTMVSVAHLIMSMASGGRKELTGRSCSHSIKAFNFFKEVRRRTIGRFDASNANSSEGSKGHTAGGHRGRERETRHAETGPRGKRKARKADTRNGRDCGGGRHDEGYGCVCPSESWEVPWVNRQCEEGR
ncbi:hypothetical protein B0H16DRAFT_1472643 [Mycena metata]|uniref:Uncharacterized protein n=1 Tax=Mycena metata TaxID=1033252 RepID=A0AAD7HMC6_9AGAR|nr:hypothetical protein B0H16DRAFT_1472643 [Mycena metata]